MWFRRLLLSYLPVFFIVTMILFVIFFQTLNEQNRREAIKANEFLAQQVILFTDNSLKSIDYQVLREILTNSVVDRFFSSNRNDVYANIQALNVMNDLKFNHPIIDSIYFYRFSDGYAFGDAPSPMEEFPDAAFIGKHKELTNPSRWTGEREFKAFSNSTGERVITLVRAAPYNMRAKQGYFVVNVSLTKLQKFIGHMYNPDNSFVSMIDTEGQNLFGENESHPESGAILSSFTSPYTGWEIDSGIVNKTGMRIALNFYNVWVMFAVAVVVFGILWVIYVTKRNYKPVQQLVSLVETFSLKYQGTGAGNDGEFSFIQNTLENLVNETKQFQEQYRDKLILQKNYHFHQVLEGSVQIRENEWISELRNYDLDVAGKTSIVHVMEIDDYKLFTETYSQQDQSLLKFTLYSVIYETAQINNAAVWAEWTTDRRISFILWMQSAEDAIEKSTSIINTSLNWVEQNLIFSITVGKGEPASSLEELRRSYEMANHCLQFKAVLGKNRMIAVQDTVRPQKEIQEYFKTIYLLFHSIRLADKEYQKHLNVFFNQIRESLLPRKEIESLMQFFVHHLEIELLELSKDYRNIWRSVQAELHALALRWDTVDELQQGCIWIFELMNEKIQEQRDSHSNKALIIEIRSYIENNFAYSDMSLDHLSSKFQLNSKYLSKMFKDEFGENFVDFLIGLRIQYAKQMLLETQKTMQSISNEVGYYNYNSFNRAFKNVVGLSPRDYRKQLGDVN